MRPADLTAREPHPREQTRCYSGAVDVAALEQQLSEQHERYLRLAADFENFKKRTAQGAERRAAAQKETFIRDLLPVIDNLDRAVAHPAPALTDPFRQGVQMTFRQFVQVMREHGFEPREDVGQPFDPNYHEAVTTRAEPEHAHHSIVEVWQRGWLRGNELFRAAKVVVNDLGHETFSTDEGRDQERELSNV
jgi:molecular chaperone GrpE